MSERAKSRATSHVRRATSDMRRASSNLPRATSDVRRAGSDVPRATSDVPRATPDVRRATADERLQKILSAAGVASRRHSEALILEGRVTVNGETVTELGTKANPTRDDIRVDGRRIRVARRLRYILLNKPRGYVTTRSDPQRRPTVMDLLPDVHEYVYPVGRLDFDSEGLLLLTNDGDLAARLTHPRHEVERVYEARVRGVPDAHELQRLERGVLVDGQRTAPARVHLSRASAAFPRPPAARVAGARSTAAEHTGRHAPQSRGAGPQAVVVLSVHEGRHRQVRKMLEAIGHPVVRLRRIRLGPIADDKLAPGRHRELTTAEVAALKRAAGITGQG